MMRQTIYDVYGIGNALVDIEIEVDDEFLAQNDIAKGMMTLVDEERQNSLMQAINNHITKKQCGGSAANSLIAISQFGGKCYYSCKVANDELGKFFLEDLRKSGVNSNLEKIGLGEGITGKCLVMVTPDADRTLNTFLGITADFSINELDLEALKQSRCLYMEGYLISTEKGQQAMRKAATVARSNNVLTSLTFSDPSMVRYFSRELMDLIGPGVDLLFCNEEEALLFTNQKKIAEARENLKSYARKFVITQGKNGAIVFDGVTFIDIEAYPVSAVDSNGAGDMFAGAFLYAINHGHSYAQAAKLASLAASKVVANFGPRLHAREAGKILMELMN